MEGGDANPTTEDGSIVSDLEGGSSEPKRGSITSIAATDPGDETDGPDIDDEDLEGEGDETEGEPAKATDEPPAEEPSFVFDQAKFDARMAELAAQAPAAAPVETPTPEGAPATPPAAPITGLDELLSPIDTSAFKYDSEFALAERLNKVQDVLRTVVEQQMGVQQIHVRQVAETVAVELQRGASEVASTYGIQMSPEQVDQLLRRNIDIAKRAKGFTSAVVMEAFERENWREIMAAAQSKPAARASSTPAPKTLSGDSATAMRLPAGEEKLTENELILRDLGAL